MICFLRNTFRLFRLCERSAAIQSRTLKSSFVASGHAAQALALRVATPLRGSR